MTNSIEFHEAAAELVQEWLEAAVAWMHERSSDFDAGYRSLEEGAVTWCVRLGLDYDRRMLPVVMRERLEEMERGS